MPNRAERIYTYTIRSGDSLWRIARRFNTTVQDIMSENPGLDPGNLIIGQTIRISNRCTPDPAQPLSRDVGGAAQALSNQMRLLWEQHVYWTRMAIMGMAFGSPDTEASVNRLLRNPKDFESALRQYYGEETAAKFSKLLTDHLTIASELVKAAKAGNSAAAADAEKRWYKNADQIAAFLGDINPYWSAQEWREMLYKHLSMTKAEAVDILTRKYEDSIAVFENIEREALAMADMMTRGITKQFFQCLR